MVEISKRLVLHFEQGQFTFRAFDPAATNEQLFNLAQKINILQIDEVKQITTVSIMKFM